MSRRRIARRHNLKFVLRVQYKGDSGVIEWGPFDRQGAVDVSSSLASRPDVVRVEVDSVDEEDD